MYLPLDILFGTLSSRLLSVIHSFLGLNNMSSYSSTYLLLDASLSPHFGGYCDWCYHVHCIYVCYVSTESAVMSKYLFGGTTCNSFGYIPAAELLHHMGLLCLTLAEAAKLLSEAAAPLYSPISPGGFQSPTFLPALVVLFRPLNSHWTGCERN